LFFWNGEVLASFSDFRQVFLEKASGGKVFGNKRVGFLNYLHASDRAWLGLNKQD